MATELCKLLPHNENHPVLSTFSSKLMLPRSISYFSGSMLTAAARRKIIKKNLNMLLLLRKHLHILAKKWRRGHSAEHFSTTWSLIFQSRLWFAQHLHVL
jgi:hypothetical protein